MNLPEPYWQSPDGAHVLYCADCLDVLPLLAAGSVDMVWTDPPFGHANMDGDLQAARVRDGVKGARVRDAEPIANDDPDSMRQVVHGMLGEAAQILKRDCCCCCCCCCCCGGPKPTFAWTAERMDQSGLSFFHAVVWDKSARGNGLGWRYRRNYEFVLVSHRKGGKLAWADESLAVPNIVRDMPPIDRWHPNEKPVSLVERFIEWHTERSDLILDPFAGSCTTAVACIRTGRRSISIEKEEKYCAIGKRRLEEAIGVGTLFDPKALESPDLFAEAVA